jgi:hypothetical protein
MPSFSTFGKAVARGAEQVTEELPRIAKALGQTPPIDPYTAIRNYQASSKTLNKLLLAAKGDVSKIADTQQLLSHGSTTIGEYVKGLDNAMQPVAEARTLYRGIKMTPDQAQNLKAGQTFTNTSFMSTSKAEEVGRLFAGNEQDGGNVIFEIITNKGSVKGADVDNVLGSNAFKEDEVILGRNQQFDITNVEYRNGRKYVTMKPKGAEDPLIYRQRYNARGDDTNVINLPLKNGGYRTAGIIQKPDYLLPKILSKSEEELATKYPDVDVVKLKQMAQQQLKSIGVTND